MRARRRRRRRGGCVGVEVSVNTACARRALLEQSVRAAGALFAAGLLPVGGAGAAVPTPPPGWPQDAFRATHLDRAVAALFGRRKPQPSDDVLLGAPEIAENGAVVPVTVRTALSGVRSICLLVEKNPFPLAARYLIPGRQESYLASRLKLRETSSVIALVETDDRLLSASKVVKVTIGGCG